MRQSGSACSWRARMRRHRAVRYRGSDIHARGIAFAVLLKVGKQFIAAAVEVARLTKHTLDAVGAVGHGCHHVTLLTTATAPVVRIDQLAGKTIFRPISPA